MIVLVTGATGFIGKALSARLAAEGHTLRVLTRNPQHTQGLPPGTAAFSWPAGGMVPDAALDGADAVVHLAGENIGEWPWTPERKRRILESRVHGTRRLVEAMGRADPKPKVLVAASGMGFYGDGGERELDETAEPGTDFLAGVCTAWETESFRADEMGIRTVAVRNGLVLGRGGALAKMLPAFRFGAGAVIGSGRQWWSWIHVEDTAGIFAHALTAEGLRGPVNGAAPAPARQRDFSRALARAVHRPLLLRAPAFALRPALGEMSSVLLEGQKADGCKLAASGYAFRHAALDAALKNILSGG